MPTRATIEAVLRAHTQGEVVRNVWQFEPNFRKQIDALCDDLLTLLERPQPSREALVQILDEEVRTYTHQHRGRFIDKLMAWAQGELRRMWCKHLEWRVFDKEDIRPSGYYNVTEGQCFYYAGDFQFCPICATPRPQESPNAPASA